MKSNKKSSNFTARALSIAIAVALIICAVFSFGFIGLQGGALADDDVGGTSQGSVRTENGVRFVQVAAGKDFAIGLTFDGKLYGWSLIGSVGGQTSLDTATLGTYYSSVPTQIDVKFLIGPGDDGEFDWDDDPEYHYPSEKGDRIVGIAATRTTAAFITDKGYIYTWGKDSVTNNGSNEENIYMQEGASGQPHYLLLRPLDTHDVWYEPYMIDYNYYGVGNGVDEPMQFIIPTESNKLGKPSIAASEYNYIFGFTKSVSSVTSFYTYVWGSLMYSVPNITPTGTYDYRYSTSSNDLQGGPNIRKIHKTAYGGDASVSVVAGGYNVGINGSAVSGGTSLQLRGRNFLTSQYSSSSGYVYTLNTVTATVSGSGNSSDSLTNSGNAYSNITYSQGKDFSAAQGVIGGNGNNADIGLYGTGVDTEQFYGRQAYASGLTYRVDAPNVYINNAHGDSLNSNVYATAQNFAVSLGNDMGYGISGGDIYGWGDNFGGQLKGLSEKTYPTPTTILSGNYVSVAAGKQLSADNKAFHVADTLATTGSGDSLAVTGFNDDVKNDPIFISGAIDSTGNLVVWSYFDRETSVPVTIKYGDITGSPTAADRFVAVYGGYGNHFFAITSLGKLIHIEYNESKKVYEQHRYDDFKDTAKNDLKWSVDSTNKVTFTVPKAAQDATTEDIKSPDLGSATFYVWTAPTTADSVMINGVRSAQTWTQGKYNTLVNNNDIGDVYRILSGADDEKTFLRASSTDADTFEPVFMYDGVKMNELQQQNMFDYEIVNDVNNGVGIKITPQQSSKGFAVTAVFYIARYNYKDNFTSSTDTALYYDYKECRIEFTIEDTPSVVEFETELENGNSRIPLLDPNNEYNKQYSIAVQDVSTGVDELIKYLTKSETTVNEGFKTAVVEQMEKDTGFPSTSKITDGNLSYYLGESVADPIYYTGKYSHLFGDRDADRVRINSGTNGVELSPFRSPINNNAITAESTAMTVTVPITEAFGVDSDRLAAIATDFNNKYGFYDIVVAQGGSSITFKYDIIRFTAVRSTGNIIYDGNAVSSFKTASDQTHINVTVNAQTATTYKSDTASVAVNGNTSNIAALFSQASLRLKDHDVDGQADGGNVLTVNYANRIYVGNSAKIELKDYVDENTLDSYIYFTYKDSINSFDAFNGKFTDETGEGIKTVDLDSRNLVVTPTINKPINITVTIQRFVNSSGTRTAFAGGNEKIDITFIFGNISTFTFDASSNVTSKFTIKKSEKIDLFGGYINGVRYNPFAQINGVSDATALANIRGRVKISGIQSTGAGIFTVSEPNTNDPTAITINPVSSGNGILQFVATVYGQSVRVSLTINVSFVTLLTDDSDAVSLVDDEYVYVNILMSKLKKANSFNDDIDSYKVLFNDIRSDKDAAGKNIYNAIYFTTEPYATFEERVGYPTFIKSVTFEGVSTTQPYIRIEPSASAVSSSTTYYMHVRYADTTEETYEAAPDGSILEVIFEIESGKVVVPLSDSAAVKIDCKNGRKTDAEVWYTRGSGVNTVAHISAKSLLDYISREDSTNYRIFHVSADDGAAQYFNYDFNGDNEVVITPLYNTPNNEEYAVNVSVYNSRTKESLVLTFNVSVDGILTVLPVVTDDDGVIGYGNIWLYSFIIVFGVLLIIFVIRLIVYWKKRAKQRALIKRNQELIRMRDRIHNKANIASKEQVVRTKMKMEDPKYAKLFNEMRKDKENESGIVLENSDLAATAKSKSKKKKKGGKKTVAELKAELEAKKAAFAAAQAQSAQPVNPFVGDVPIADGSFDTPPDAFATPVDGFDANNNGFASPDLDEKEIIFDASDIGDGM